MSEKMTEAQVLAELERINPAYARSFPHSSLPQKELYRLLAESQRALGEIAEHKSHITHMGSGALRQTYECDMCNIKIAIARKHYRGGK